MKQLIEDFKAPTPKKWRKVRNALAVIAAVSAFIIGSPVALPAALVTAATYGAYIGGAGALLSQFKKEPNEETKENAPLDSEAGA